MAIKIKHRDPKSTDFSSTDIIININEGTLFYKTPTGLFKLQGDNLNTSNTEITLNNSITGSLNISETLTSTIVSSTTGS